MNAGVLRPRFQNEKQNCTDSGVKKKRGRRGSLWIYISWLVVFRFHLLVCLFWLLSSAFYQTAQQAYKLD